MFSCQPPATGNGEAMPPPKKRNNKKIMKNIKIIIAFNIICLLLFAYAIVDYAKGHKGTFLSDDIFIEMKGDNIFPFEMDETNERTNKVTTRVKPKDDEKRDLNDKPNLHLDGLTPYAQDIGTET